MNEKILYKKVLKRKIEYEIYETNIHRVENVHIKKSQRLVHRFISSTLLVDFH